jgi:hypothetical protein
VDGDQFFYDMDGHYLGKVHENGNATDADGRAVGRFDGKFFYDMSGRPLSSIEDGGQIRDMDGRLLGWQDTPNGNILDPTGTRVLANNNNFGQPPIPLNTIYPVFGSDSPSPASHQPPTGQSTPHRGSQEPYIPSHLMPPDPLVMEARRNTKFPGLRFWGVHYPPPTPTPAVTYPRDGRERYFQEHLPVYPYGNQDAPAPDTVARSRSRSRSTNHAHPGLAWYDCRFSVNGILVALAVGAWIVVLIIRMMGGNIP